MHEMHKMGIYSLTRNRAEPVVRPRDRPGHAGDRVRVPAEGDGHLDRVHDGVVLVGQALGGGDRVEVLHAVWVGGVVDVSG